MFNWLKRLFKNETADLNNPLLLQWLGVDPETPKDQLAEATYFACLKILAESLGKLPLKMYQRTERGVVKSDKENVYNILKLRPNQYMTSSVFWSTVEMNRNHYGNAYVWCRYNGPQLQDMWILPSQYVTIVVDDGGILGEKTRYGTAIMTHTTVKCTFLETMKSCTLKHQRHSTALPACRFVTF